MPFWISAQDYLVNEAYDLQGFNMSAWSQKGVNSV